MPTYCSICGKEYAKNETPTHIFISYDHEDWGTYDSYYTCETCRVLVKNEINKAIHKVKYDARKKGSA